MSILQWYFKGILWIFLYYSIFVKISTICDYNIPKKDEAFLANCYFVKYLIKTSFKAFSVEEFKELVEFVRFIKGLTSMTAEQKIKKSWIELSLATENWDFVFTISSLDLKLPF